MMWTTIRREFWPAPMPQTLNEEPLWRDLGACESVDVLKALGEFGSLLVSEAQARASALDAKASSLLGWNAGGAAVFLAALPTVMANSVPRWIIVVGAMASMLGSVLAFFALRVRATIVPSQVEWLDAERCDSELRIRRAHLLTMKRWLESDALANRTRGAFAKNAQWCLVLVSMTLAWALLAVILPPPAL